ncbi:MAG: permease-like cell division protein FtsX [Candidatus Poribacteria bacterium]|nr:permease-like cell division protein FtsX [Candidatus Poribacteria bacterium]
MSALILVGNYLHREVEDLKDEPAVIAFLKDTVGESEGLEFRSQIEKMDQVASVSYVSKAEALARSEQAFGELGAIITQGFEDINPLPASLEIYVEGTSLNREALEQFAHHIKSFREIEDVSYEQYSSEFIRKAEMVIVGLGGLMGGASVIIVCFSIMLTAYFRREEIRVMKLVGATYWYIRLPLIAQGIFLGFMGSLSGVGSFYALFRLFTPRIGEMAFIPFNQLALILLGGVLIGLLGSILPIRKYVNV